MKKPLSLRTIDRWIAAGFFVALIPIYISMCLGYKLIDQLNYFADVLAVLAALYAGRTVFFSSEKELRAVYGANAPRMATAAENKTESSDTCECQNKEKDFKADSNNLAEETDDEPLDETPQQVFYAMSVFLGVYAFIKLAVFLGKDNIWPEIVLGTLLITGSCTFASISIGRAVKYKKRVVPRFWLSLLFGLAAGIGASIVFAQKMWP